MRKDTVNIRTGADSIDAILGGGVPTRSITEMFGEWRYRTLKKTPPSRNTAVRPSDPSSKLAGAARPRSATPSP